MTLHPTYGPGCKDSNNQTASIFTSGCNLVYWSEVLGASDAKVECPFAPGGVGDKDAYKEGNVVGISWK